MLKYLHKVKKLLTTPLFIQDPQQLSSARLRRRHHRAESQGGIALLIALTAITVLSLVIVDFSRQSTLHLNEGVFIRDEVRANILADTALDMTRACLDRKAWGPMGAFQSKINLERLCNMLLGVFIRRRLAETQQTRQRFSIFILSHHGFR